MLTRASRILVLLASLALLGAYAFPLWTIDLEAPQYPEGLGMVIRINTIEGVKPNDLRNINNLNHYIGMKRIEPESIPELRIMPFVVAALLLGGLLVAAFGRRAALYAWVATYLVVALVGLADFYKWEYDYGHNLDDENAIIKIPGMNYQPPLIGSKQLLNFRAHSWPGAGGWILIVSALTGVAVAVSERRRHSSKQTAAPTAVVLLAVTGLAATAGCSAPEPRALVAGVDTCTRCHMAVADDASGAEVLTTRGRIYTFDSIECMVAWLDHDAEGVPVGSAWVADRAGGGRLLRAEDAFYLASESLGSPMGLGLAAFGDAGARTRALEQHGGQALAWSELSAFVAERWPGGNPPRGHVGRALDSAERIPA
ncbi:MAG: nitrous oxide reductase accessory protein NosL [Gemmatimonadota bacterium]